MARKEKLCCSLIQKAFRYYGDYGNINISRDSKWHIIPIKKSTFKEVYCKSLWIFNSSQTKMKEHSGTLDLKLKRQLKRNKRNYKKRDNKFNLIKSAENIKQAFHLWYGQNQTIILNILICLKYVPSTFAVYSGNGELSVHLELFSTF